ncbi:MAG: diguanylate cyclase [Planctomycetes bacterium]|nr:diguanylate cyclase [Planctomycetota bacterium]
MKEIIRQSAGIITISSQESIQDAGCLMKGHRIGCLIVINGQKAFVGLVTERDIATWVAEATKTAGETPISEIMTTDVITCAPKTPASQTREIMAKNRIRHLPLVNKGVLVGMLSIRDLMGQQLIEDRAAAEEVAMLSNCLKSIDLSEAGDIVATEAPKLFQADKCMLALYREGDTEADPELDSQHECVRPRDCFRQSMESGEMSGEEAVLFETVPPECSKLNASGPRMLIPINLPGVEDPTTEENRGLKGYLCMCGLDESIAANKDLLSYKAKLTKKILTSHLTNATLYHQARLTSLTDALTGIGSRKMLEDKLEAELVRSQRYDSPFSIAIIDLDNFKTINDVLGHATGDDALKKLAESMKTVLRTLDVLARYGGDEFVVLMPETSLPEAQIVLERICDEVHEIRLPQDTPITVSCGIAPCLPGHDKTPSDVIRRADLALYEAKNSGRDCVKVWHQELGKLLNTDDLEIGKVKELQRRVVGLSEKAEQMFMQSIWGMVKALEARNSHAENHSANVMGFATGIAKGMEVGPKHIDIIRRAAMLHDIGNIGVPDDIMTKPGQLTRSERQIVEQHPVIAERILENMNFLEHEMAIVRHHHEKWNGGGYPDGLSKEAIPQGSRIIAIAETLDALTSERPYREAISLNEAIKIVVDASGYDFDPEAVKGLLCWIEDRGKALNKTPDLMTAADLLESQRQEDPDRAKPATAEAPVSAA